MKNTVKILLLIIFISQILQLSAADLDNNSIIIKPSFELPLGEKSSVFNADAPYKPGGAVSFNLQYIPPNTPLFFFTGVLGYSISHTGRKSNSTKWRVANRSQFSFWRYVKLKYRIGIGMVPGNVPGE